MQSETIGKLAEALAKAQGAMDNPARSAENPFFKSKYAPLSAITDAIRKPLSQNGLSYVQTVSMQSDIVMLTTRLMHMSGEWIESAMPLPHVGKPQELGSVMTYFRRYQLSAIVGITADDDDDGNEASGNRAQPAQRQPAKQSTPTSNGARDLLRSLDEVEHKHHGHEYGENPFGDEVPATPRIERNVATEKQHKMLFALGKQLYGDNWDNKRAELVKAVTGGRSESAGDLTVKEMSTLLDGLKKRADDKAAIADVTLANVPEMAH